MTSTQRVVTIPPVTQWSETSEAILNAPYDHFCTMKGLGTSHKLFDAVNEVLKVPEDKYKLILKISHILGASCNLALDDLDIGSEQSRGYAATPAIFGVPQTINTAGYLFVLVMEVMAELQALHPSADLNSILVQEIKLVHRGQALENHWQNTMTCPTEEECIDVMNKKTAAFFRLFIRLMQACATQNQNLDFVPVSNTLGVFFQIWRDLKDLESGTDISEGKFTFPIRHAIAYNPKNPLIKYCLAQHSAAPPVIEKVMSYLRDESKSIEYSKETLKILQGQIQAELKSLGGSAGIESLVNELLSSLQ
ncbi:hypothetical protein VNI00_011413 [Paramarasmius palmivorus]|uniref:Geranylgeranyl pyrophosphate synthase n=1 Tax=Paramarasmius palmivorus TaxID=297713 RepID=A0AAW0CD37_9AGAR